MKLFIALLALALPVGLLVLHPSTARSLDWDGGGHHGTVHVAPRQLASR